MLGEGGFTGAFRAVDFDHAPARNAADAKRQPGSSFKPLVYAATPEGGLAFASTVRSLRRAGLGATIDDLAMAELLENGYVGEERSIHAGIHKLPPATIMEWSAEGTVARRYWAPPAAGTAGWASFEDAVAETERLLLRAVELRPPRNVLGKSTVESIQSGAVYGFAAQVDGLCDLIIGELGECTVLSTGGLADLITPFSRRIQHTEPWLTLHGLRLVYEKNL